jgi:hypothetical protein
MTLTDVLKAAYPSLRCLTVEGVTVHITDHGVDVQLGSVVPDGQRLARLQWILTLLPLVGWIYSAQEWGPDRGTGSTGCVQARTVIDGIPWKVWVPLDVIDLPALSEWAQQDVVAA